MSEIYFKQDRAIYLQLADRLCDEIISGKYKADDKIPSVRELAVMLEVNTNTVVKTYDHLSLAGIIYTRRGLGYFVSPEAKEKILDSRKKQFFDEDLPEIFRQMRLLGISIDEVTRRWGKEI